MKLYYIATGETFTIKNVEFNEKGYECPTKWFTTNPGKKPTIKVLYSQDKADLRRSLVSALYAEISTNEINMEHAITFLYIYAKDSMKEMLAEDWMSYSLTIGTQGSTITPLDIIDVQLQDSAFEDLRATDVHLPLADDWLALYLCTLYRLGKIDFNQKEYRKRITNDAMRRIQQISGGNNAIKALNFDDRNLYSSIPTNNCYHDCNYRGLIAAYDMFLYKFPNNSAAFCRFATSESRLRDCAALSSYFNASKCLGMTNFGELSQWIFMVIFKEESKRWLTNKEEYSNEYSYCMYQMDFQLSGRSACSASANPYVYFFCSSVLAILLDERGLRTKKLIDGCPPSLTAALKWAIIVSYIFRSGATLEEQSDPNEPKSRDYNEWKVFLEGRNFELTKGMKQWFESKRAKITQTRPGTIGDYLRNLK